MLSILEKIPALNEEVILEIEPLAPLSMVSDLPGSYYKTLKFPSKKMVSGLFENILEWHIDAKDRKEIIKEVRKIRNRQKLKFPDVSGSTYEPLLIEYFEIKLQMTSSSFQYDDYWCKAFRRADAIVHPKGTFNLSHELIAQKRELLRNEKKPNQVDDKALESFFKKEKDSYPLYYSSPTSREYICFDGHLSFKLLMDSSLYLDLSTKLEYNNISYLGNSEGWVNIKISKL